MRDRGEKFALGPVGAGFPVRQVLGLLAQDLVFLPLVIQPPRKGLGGQPGGERAADGAAHQGGHAEGGEGGGQADEFVLEPCRNVSLLNQNQKGRE